MTPAATLHAHLERRISTELAISLDLTLAPGITVLFGPSGAGKTSVLQMLAGLARPDAGAIRLGDRVLFDATKSIDVAPQQRRIGYVFQHLALFPHMTAAENVMFGLTHVPVAERQHRARMLLEEFFGLGAIAAKKVGLLSGGEKQRVALARALAPQPDLLLLDEPLSALDLPTKSRILEEIVTWSRHNPVPILYVTHDREEIFSAAQHVVMMDRGKIVAEGKPDHALLTPRTLQVAHSAGFENVFDARVIARDQGSGTMMCDLGGVVLECPLSYNESRERVNIAIRAGDILLASEPPRGLSARNIIAGTVTSLAPREHAVEAQVTCTEGDSSVTFLSHITPRAVESLRLEKGSPAWIVLKTHSCHILQD